MVCSAFERSLMTHRQLYIKRFSWQHRCYAQLSNAVRSCQSLTSATSTQNVIDDDQGLNCTTYFLLFRLCHGGTSMFHHLPCLIFRMKKKAFSSGLGSKKSSRLFINRALSCSPVWHLGHYSTVMFLTRRAMLLLL
jgi:hypothetical protein